MSQNHAVKIMELIWNQSTGQERKRVLWYLNVCTSCAPKKGALFFFFLSNSSEGDSSVNNVIEVQAQRSEFKSQHPS